jgi:hypothetical protein
MEYTLTNNSNVCDISAEQLYNYSEKANQSLFLRFFDWCSKQEDNRFLWLGVTFFFQIGAILPITVWAILYLGNNSLLLWIIALVVNVPSLILNLGAAHTKFTLPIFFFALLTETIVIAYCLVFFLMH